MVRWFRKSDDGRHDAADRMPKRRRIGRGVNDASDGRPPLTIVGIGASAGGLDAFHAFFEAMPGDSGLAFVVILHLPAGRRSMLAEILGRWTTMPVVEADDWTSIKADHVYVPPPHAAVALEDGRLRIRFPAADAPRDYRPIDGFFDTLAIQLGENAVGIILSGTGSDGALGLKAIKERSGLTMAQGSESSFPQYDGMPAGAIATGAVDLVLPVEDMPGHLVRIQRARLPSATGEAAPSPEEVESARQEICTLLRTRLGHDFSSYKDKTFLRRVQRRMQVLNIATLRGYIGRLEAEQGEAALLFRDLLIRVTSFFRDADTFEVLERVVMPRLFEGKHADATVRIWVPGCATGEEAYSLAILLRERVEAMQGAPKVQVFGTDIDEPAIATARLGRYPATLLDGISPERLARFFVRSDNSYAVTKEIREICTFSPHSLVRDPPFSRMDMISCRNLLIYMDVDLQGSVIPAFHYSLVEGGMLVLGSSESTARHSDLFEPLDKGARVFRRREGKSPSLRLGGRAGLLETAARSEQRRTGTGRASWPPGSVLGEGGGAGLPPDRLEPVSAAWRGRPSARPRLRFGSLRATIARWIHPHAGDRDGLEEELWHTREELQSISEEHGTALEELRSANEELHSVNEELQSTNEELETSKEEINEELHTVNTQLSGKVDELDEANADLRNLFDSTRIATVFLDRHLIVRSFTPAAAGVYNLIPSDQGRPLSDIAPRVRYDNLRHDVEQVLQTQEPLERRVVRLDGQAHFIVRMLPYRAPDSSVRGTVVTFVDITSIVRAEERQRLMIDELNHRVKNMLTVVISLAQQTVRRSATLDEFSTAFLGRVRALTASYTLLSKENWVSVSLLDVLREETRPFTTIDGSNIRFEGPEVRLDSAGAMALGMAIHELATNAVKHGALSEPQGRVIMKWRFAEHDGREQFEFEWREAGGPPVSPPTKRGFGMTVIERGFAHELGGNAEVVFAPAGLQATLRAPAGPAVYAGGPASEGVLP